MHMCKRYSLCFTVKAHAPLHLYVQNTCGKICATCSSVTHANLLEFEHIKKREEKGKPEAPVQKSSTMTDTYV
jgi:hypothetical protein